MEAIRRYIRIFRRRHQKARMKRRYNKYLAGISEMMKTSTLCELDFSAGYFTGAITTAAEVGEIEADQKLELVQILQYIYEGERKKRESE